MNKTENYIPSNKVGIVLLVAVLIVVTAIFGSKIKINKTPNDLKSIDLVVERKIPSDFKSGDSDNDGLSDWLEEFYKSDPNNPDTDNDGTKDGAEVEADRNPVVAGPNDPLITRKDMFETEIDFKDFVSGTMTDKLSVELFSEYIQLRKEGKLTPETEQQMISEISKKALENASLKPKYVLSNLNITQSSVETVSIYGDRLAQSSLQMLSRIDSYKNMNEKEYLSVLSKEYKTFATELLEIRTPSVVQDAHLELVNYAHATGVFLDSLIATDKDPISSFMILNQYKSIKYTDAQLYTILGQYFKNNGIIFDTDSTKNFWAQFQN